MYVLFTAIFTEAEVVGEQGHELDETRTVCVSVSVSVNVCVCEAAASW